ncbi:hypothetical protein C4D60_Mb05t04930 [Musa balbisiana]|uniref:Leucine-rich repeat-containing N-terminal plant-type domain-containing protein n=1 Tax=Musa balbisiana TaxID=52838 RepID=A0A4S8JTT7_MUSBA|nr:hypothetical protein C4D60_Mb05t04930 [Musa balbisiana]
MAFPLCKGSLFTTMILLLLSLSLVLTTASLGCRGRCSTGSPLSGVANWTGVTCNAVTRKGSPVITEIHLPSMGLAGPIDAL